MNRTVTTTSALLFAALSLAALPAGARDRRGGERRGGERGSASAPRQDHARARSDAGRPQGRPQVESRSMPRRDQAPGPGYQSRSYGPGEGRASIAPRGNYAAPRGNYGYATPRGNYGYSTPRGNYGYATPRGNYGAPSYRGYDRPYYSRPYSRSYNYVPYRPYYFGRPYYSFRPHLSIGFGLWIGDPVPYPWGYLGTYRPRVFGYYDSYGPYATPSVSVYGGVSFDIRPSEAEVFVDGEYVGTAGMFPPNGAPLTLTPGVHQIGVQLEGFRPMDWSVTIQPGQVVPYRGDLQQNQ
jgi:hypothetical protein